MILTIGIAGLLLILYFAGVIKTAVSGYGVSFHPFRVIACCFRYGFPGKEFLLLLVIGVVLLVSVAYKIQKEGGEMDILGRKFKLSKERQVYGDVHFETPKEFRDIAFVQSVDDAMGTILGQMDDKGKEIINTNMKNTRDNNHMMIVGASGSGKSFTFTKPFCYQCVKRRESVIITDPDGGLFRDMAGYFWDNGYVVRHFDLNVLKKSDGWDCLKSIQGDDIEVMAQMFANTIMSNLVDDVGSIYGSGPMSLLKACILRVALDDGSSFPPEKKNIESVYAMLQNPEGEAYLDSMFMQASMPPGTEPALGPYLAFKQGSPNLRGNLITNLAVQLQLLQNKLVCQVLSSDDIDMALPAQQPCAYFCGFPDSHDTYKFIVSLFFSMLFIKLIAFADRQPNGRCPVPVNFLLDEFAAIGRIPDFDRKIATVRKRSMNIIMIFQDLTQLQNLYEKSWVTLMENCATFISLGINDQETAGFLNKRIGETTVEVKTVQHDAIESIFRVYNRNSTGEGKRALLSFDELFRIDRDSCVILHSGHNPIFAHKYPHTLHPAAKKLRPINVRDIPDITDIAGRAEYRKREQIFVEDYMRRHPLSEVDRTYANLTEPLPDYTIGDEIKRMLAELLEQYIVPANRALQKPGVRQPEKPDRTEDVDNAESFEIISEGAILIEEPPILFPADDSEEASVPGVKAETRPGPKEADVKHLDEASDRSRETIRNVFPDIEMSEAAPPQDTPLWDAPSETPSWDASPETPPWDAPPETPPWDAPPEDPCAPPESPEAQPLPVKTAAPESPQGHSEGESAPGQSVLPRQPVQPAIPAAAPCFISKTPSKKLCPDDDPGYQLAQNFKSGTSRKTVSDNVVRQDTRLKAQPKSSTPVANMPPPKKNRRPPG